MRDIKLHYMCAKASHILNKYNKQSLKLQIKRDYYIKYTY